MVWRPHPSHQGRAVNPCYVLILPVARLRSAGLAVASLSPLWGGLQHGLLAGGLMQLNATIGAPGYGRLVWKWALSRLACDLQSAKAGSRGAAGGMDGLAEGASLRDYSSCVHGLGHGLLMQAMGGHAHGFGDKAAAGALDHEGHGALPAAPSAAAALEVALAACGAAPRPAEGCQCASGAFMQAQMEGDRGSQSSLLTMCRAAAPGLSVGCWLRYWTEHPAGSPGNPSSWEAAPGVVAIGVDDACALVQVSTSMGVNASSRLRAPPVLLRPRSEPHDRNPLLAPSGLARLGPRFVRLWLVQSRDAQLVPLDVPIFLRRAFHAAATQPARHRAARRGGRCSQATAPFRVAERLCIPLLLLCLCAARADHSERGRPECRAERQQ